MMIQEDEKVIVEESLYCLKFLVAKELSDTETPSISPASAKFVHKATLNSIEKYQH